MKPHSFIWASLFSLAVVGSSFSVAKAEDDKLSVKLLLLAAASTTDALEQIRGEFLKLHPEVNVRSSYGASSALAQQIEAGAEADIFLSASNEWAEFLQKKGLVHERSNLLGNQLVVIVPTDLPLTINSPADLSQAAIRHLALADTKAVPAGVYARQALTKLDLWKSVESRVTGAPDVRQTLRFVETGAAEAGIVYVTDAAASKQVRIACRIDPKLSDPIHYPVVLLKHGADNQTAVRFYQFLKGPAAGAVFRQHGFIVLAQPEPARP